jgi:GMP synthase (glutamine-hydrolysing)
MPVLGVCFGHQVLADALGGTVGDMGSYEIGYRDVELGDDPLFAGVESPATVFTTHSDAVTELPPEAEQIAENDYGVHGFRVGNAVGVQFHPEYDPATAREVASGKDLPDERIERVLEGITETNYAAACEAKALFENFVGSVREQPADEASAARAGETADD